ncbi:hypothetical protein BDN71DRAFT_1440872 [Pleurotus eryngii]|uniref:Uncharacterized protein n=1 Tax=Pleurotus eryngii TaxID=5323 RepID=A0A9P6A9L9_PLEER|nr:hypothetical protein BDN71DRAFT_1440872 [Pleurotus eryngii]
MLGSPLTSQLPRVRPFKRHARLLVLNATDERDRPFAVNVRGTFLCYKHAIDAMIKRRRGGRIVCACSNAGKKGIAEAACYSSTKFADRGLTQSAAQEYGKLALQ